MTSTSCKYILDELGHATSIYTADQWVNGLGPTHIYHWDKTEIDICRSIDKAGIKGEDILFVHCDPCDSVPVRNSKLSRATYMVSYGWDMRYMPSNTVSNMKEACINLFISLVSKPLTKTFISGGIDSVWMPATFIQSKESMSCTDLDFEDDGRMYSLAYTGSFEGDVGKYRRSIINPLLDAMVPLDVHADMFWYYIGQIKHTNRFNHLSEEDKLTAMRECGGRCYSYCNEFYNKHIGTINTYRKAQDDNGEHMVTRMFNATASKSCLFQLRPTEDSGFYEVFKDMDTCIIWNDVDHLISLAEKYIMEDPQVSIDISKKAYQLYEGILNQKTLRSQLVDFVSNKKPLPEFCRYK